MSKVILLLFVFITQAYAKHPSLIETSIEGVNYVCRPAQEKVLCPSLTVDNSLNIEVGTLACLLDLSTSSERDKIGSCYHSIELKKFFDKIQLMYVSSDCLNDHVFDCQKKMLDRSESFSESYKSTKWLITQEEAVGICKSFIY